MIVDAFAVISRSRNPLAHLFKRLVTGGFLLFSLTLLLLASNLLTPIRMAFASLTTHGSPLSGCSFDANRSVTIGGAGCGPDVYVDQSFTGASAIGVISIAAGGKLSFNSHTPRRLDTAAIVVSGVLEAGSPANRITDKNAVTINFTSAASGVPGVTKGITVNAGGSLKLFGASGVAAKGSGSHAPSWTYLSAPAGPSAAYGPGLGVASPVSGVGAATTLRLADVVDWGPGQWIVVAGTDFSPDSAEFVQISTANCKKGRGCTITLNPGTPLVNYHYGGSAPPAGSAAFRAGVAHNYGVDERAEVGLVSRNIKLTATVPAGSADGGEIKILSGFKEVKIQGVEIEKFGKGKLGSYPIHFHRAGTAAASAVLVDSNSIHHSYNKCVTLHATNGVTISNNVCARAVGHLYYLETGAETNDAFIGNLGIGAMSNEFAISSGNAAAQAAFWPGDYLARGVGGAGGNGYRGFKVPFTDKGKVNGAPGTASGFWIPNLGGNTFSGNSIAGCQAVGRGFWILPAAYTSAVTAVPGRFSNNRAHGCYNGFDTAADDGVTGAADYTPQGPCPGGASGSNNCDVVAEFDGVTATRNRNRGIWVRASWYAIKNARLATNRDGVSLVSSGGTEGSPPGEWSLLSNAIIVGISANNPLRFGPCPYAGQNGFGGNAGCYEVVRDNGYPQPSWNLAGMMFYDGPARLENVRFVNFNKDIAPYLTAADAAFLTYYSTNGNTIPGQSRPFVYEGDAAMGWFQSNVNSYPPTQYVKGLSYYNVDLRHQVYTQDVGLTAAPVTPGSNFRDGDKFTVILDRDASLTGFHVTNASGVAASGVYPISLNNLPFLSGPNTVDECHSTGQQDAALEDRPTSLISPYSYATLEFTALTPPCLTAASGPQCTNNNILIFTKDQRDYVSENIQFTDSAINNSDDGVYAVKCGGAAGASGVPGHACVALSGRNGNGIYEPKVVNGLGYTVGASAGVPGFVSLTYTDARLPGAISGNNPFHTRIGICYKNQGAQAPAATAFTVTKGSKSLGGINTDQATFVPNYFNLLNCTGLDNFNPLCSGTSCAGICPSAPYYSQASGVSPAQAASGVLPAVSRIADLDDPVKCPNGECYFYDQTSGLLFLNMVQEQPNAGGPYSSPLGSCAGKKDANGICTDESFYSCPGAGCELYAIQADSSYAPTSPSACTPYAGAPDYTQDYPANMNQLATASGPISTSVHGASGNFPHRVLTNAPPHLCPTHAPQTPDWASAPSATTAFTLSPGSGATAAISSGTTNIPEIPGTAVVLLTPGQTYTLAASSPSGSCSQQFTVAASGVGFTSDGNNQCQMVASSSSNVLTPSAGPYSQWFTLSPPSNVTAAVSGVTATNNRVLLAPGSAYTLTASSPSSSCTQSFTVNSEASGYTSTGDMQCGMPAEGETSLELGSAPYPARFHLGVPATVTAYTITYLTKRTKQRHRHWEQAPVLPGGNVLLTSGTEYTLTVSAVSSTCEQRFTVLQSASAVGFTSSGNNCCQIGTGTTWTATIGPGAGPYSCTGGSAR